MLLQNGSRQSAFYSDLRPISRQCCPGFGIPWASYHNLLPVSLGVRRCSDIDTHPRTSAELVAVLRQLLAFPNLPRLPLDFPIEKRTKNFKTYMEITVMTHICTFQHQLQLYFNQSWPCVLCNVFLSILTFHSSSSLLICCADTCLALSCSCSEGTFTNHGKNCLSWINGCHWDGSLLIDQNRVEIVFKNYKRLIGVFCSAAVLLYFHDFFSQYFELIPTSSYPLGWMMRRMVDDTTAQLRSQL